MFNWIKNFFTIAVDIPSRNYIVDIWESNETWKRQWCAAYIDERGKQVGIVGRGNTKQDAILDLHMQNEGVI